MELKFIIPKLLYKIVPPAVKQCELHKTCKIFARSDIQYSQIGKYSYIGYNCKITHALIGAYCSIADNVHIGGASHPMEWVSTSPLFAEGKSVFGFNFSQQPYDPYKRTFIGNDVWIGSGASIKSGVTIGNGAIVGTNSMVVEDIGDYEIWAGNPAKFIRKRFDESLCSFFREIEWWEWDDEKIKLYADLFSNPTKFKEEYSESDECKRDQFSSKKNEL